MNKNHLNIRQMSHLLTSLTILLSVLVLAGWTFGINILSRPVSGTAAMNPLTAICFILSGLSLILLKRFGSTSYLKILGIILASVVLTLAVVILVEIFFDTDTRIDTWLFYDKMNTGIEGFTLNYMAPNTAVGFILTSFSLLVLNKQTNNKWVFSQLLALFVGFITMLTLLGYLYNVNAFYAPLNFFPMAIYTAIGFLFISMAILFVNNDKGFMSAFSGTNSGSVMARALLPAALIIPISLGLIRHYFEHEGLKYLEFSIGLLVLSNMVVFIVLIWVNARELNKKDALRKETELAAPETANRLELATKSGEIGIWEFDVVNNKLLWDKQMCALYGLTANTFGGDYESWRKTIHPDDAERTHIELQASIKEGKGYSSEFRVVWPDSSIKTIKSTAKIERNKDGKALKFTGVNWGISDIKKDEEILQNTLEIVSNYKDALDESAIVTFTDHKGIIDQVNDNFCEISQYSREELIGQDHRMMKSGYHSKTFIGNLWKTISKGNIWRGEIKNKAKDGTFYWVNTTIVPFLNKKGEPYRYMVFRTDITEQKRLQEEIKQINLESAQKAKDRIEELSAKEEHLNSILNTVTDAIFALDVEKDGHYRFNSVNPAFLNITGLDHDMIIGKKINDIIPKESLGTVLAKYEEAIRTKKIVRWEQAIDCPNGKLIGERSIAPIFDKTGNCTKLIGSVHDLTERIKGEEELKRSESRFRNLFKNAPESLLVLDLRSQKFVKINKNASKLFKFSTKKLAELGLADISPDFQPDDTLSAEKVKGYIEKSMLGKKVTFEWVHCDANKKEIECKTLLALLPGTTDSPQIYVSIIDITEKNKTRKKLKQQFEDLEIANQELKKTNNELDRFVYSTSHDLRSPLKSLLGLFELMKDDVDPENTNQLELIGMMKKSIVKLDNFIEDILQYSRNARTEVSKEAIDFKPTIDNIINNLKHMDGAKEIKLKMEIDQDLKFVADRVRVNVVLNNLISNAIKYKDLSKKQQFLGIQIKNSNDNAVITIEDNGIGIDPKDKEKIFDMFYRGTNTSTGSGLGLYIVKEAINKLDGSIKIQSELNKGTTFIATLPNQLIALN